MSAKTDGRLGYTTTVKDQVDSIEVSLPSILGEHGSLQEGSVNSKKTAGIASV